MDKLRPTRRTRRACEPCRRKKVKCPGEQPTCSFCRRLGQRCDYRFNGPDLICETQDFILERRVEAIEGKLDHLIHSLSNSTAGAGLDSGAAMSPTSPTAHTHPEPPGTRSRAQSHTGPEPSMHRPADPDLFEAGQLYQTWCHNQPLYLFRQEGFIETLENRDPELRLAIQVHSHRFPPGIRTTEKQRAVDAMAQSCRKLITDRVANGAVKLSTIQALCVLSVVSFADGNPMQAGLDLSMAHYFMTSLPLGSSIGDTLECSLCTQSISLLQRLQEFVSDGAKTSKLEGLSRHANNLLEPFNCGSNKLPILRELGNDGDSDLGILAYANQAAKTWQMARAYAASHVGADEPPPWNPQSDYSIIMLRSLEVDSIFPLKYRFIASKFGGLTPEALQQQRDYWSPWLFVQFVHAAIPALVNHPFLLSMRLKNFRRMMPQTFIHQSFDHIARNTTWVMCFLDHLERQQFPVSDPAIAHCVAIVATIHLQHSFVKDNVLREKAKDGYDKCMRFLDRMSAIWPYVFYLVQNLRKLQDSITTLPSVTAPGCQSHGTGLSWSIDAQLLWDILIYEKAGRPNAMADRSMFSDTIVLEAELHEHDVNEFATVGSAGISGHKTVPKELSAYAPDDDESYHRLNDPLNLARNTTAASTISPSQLMYGLGDKSQMMDQDNAFLQAEDFGRSINDWFNFNFN